MLQHLGAVTAQRLQINQRRIAFQQRFTALPEDIQSEIGQLFVVLVLALESLATQLRLIGVCVGQDSGCICSQINELLCRAEAKSWQRKSLVVPMIDGPQPRQARRNEPLFS